MPKKEIKEGVTFRAGRWKLKVARTRGGFLCIDAEAPNGLWDDRSIRYPHSRTTAYDHPERIPATVKARVNQLYERMEEEGLRP